MFSSCFRNYFTTFRVLCQPHLCDTYLSPENNIYTTDVDEMCSYQIPAAIEFEKNQLETINDYIEKMTEKRKTGRTGMVDYNAEELNYGTA